MTNDQCTPEYWFWIGTAFYMCFLLNEIIVPYFSGLWFKNYDQLKRPLYFEWNGRCTSTFHAIVVCMCSIWCLLFHDELWTNKLFNTDCLSRTTLAVSCGYMIYDLITMIWYTGGVPLLTYIVHHLVVIIGDILILKHNFGMFYVHYKLLTELSTPLVNLRWFILRVGYSPKHPAFSLTTVALCVCFVTVRLIGSIPYWFWLHQSVTSLTDPDQIKTCEIYRPVFYVLSILLDCLNVAWSSILVDRAMRSLKDLKVHYRSKQQNGEIVTEHVHS
ncbi:hypothetical protein CRM22_003085 [Opisthorchis felineus]|uniref:TLC domain-containing protein n=2 Tax=Opisthorchis felineus TaxID=147828 RepID=A0A4S2M302_OPIFE|nr:hypothetical protein CRM22_003085 [Opisthorchis felineus]